MLPSFAPTGHKGGQPKGALKFLTAMGLFFLGQSKEFFCI